MRYFISLVNSEKVILFSLVLLKSCIFQILWLLMHKCFFSFLLSCFLLNHFLICVENIVYKMLSVILVYSKGKSSNWSTFGKVFVLQIETQFSKKFQDYYIFSLTHFNIFSSSLSSPKMFFGGYRNGTLD